ncbi:response regulator receiver protein [Pontibaca methylaminivorans]|uniref:Response regulator receiver protein n=2 Tax=Pontibaca methylaminivorans TaxID=515897 RepID=A0A1R3X6X7_9RHOB|nr:response regulator receiver protein [Pontibaca methylaminivorans]
METRNMRVLVVEDDYFIADQLVREICELGDEPIGPFASVGDALPVIDRAEVAILDIKLGDETSFPIADRLMMTHTPFLFLTGYDSQLVPHRFYETDIYIKPSRAEPMLKALRALHHPPQDSPAAPRVPGADGTETIEDLVMEMLRRARHVMPDNASAERLVERVLKVALQKVDQGADEQDLKNWLRQLFAYEFRNRISHLH